MVQKRASQPAPATVAEQAAEAAGGVDPHLLGSFLTDLADALDAGRNLTPGQTRRLRVHGQRAAREGVALRSLLQLYLGAARRAWPRLASSEAAAAGATVLQALEDALAALTEGFQLARRGLVREQESARREFIDDLLSGQGELATMLPRAAGFGIDLSAPHAVALVRAEHSFSDVGPLTGRLERAVQGSKGDADVLVASKDGALVVIFAAPGRSAVDEVVERLSALLGPTADGGVDLQRRVDVGEWRLGVGRAGSGPPGVRASFREAGEALAIADRLGLTGAVFDAADMLVYQVLLRDREAISGLVEALLSPLTQARGGAGPLLDTLQAYFETGGNAVRTARRLHLSVRAVTYRLDRVARLTGHDPTDTSRRFALHAAVLGARLLGWPDE